MTIDARIVIASVDTYLRFADAVGRLDVGGSDGVEGLPGLAATAPQRIVKAKTKGVIEGAAEALGLSDKQDGRQQRAARRKPGRTTRT